MPRTSSVFLLVILSSSMLFQGLLGANNIDYKGALRKSLLFFEGQRSGKLPPDQRVQWRGDSGLQDGRDSGVDLVGGYYDAGDNLKLGFPLAFTITMLSWSAVEFRDKLKANNELANTLSAIKWGTDYLIKAHPKDNVLYGEIGGVESDHQCWQRPEEMSTPRTAFSIDANRPGSDLAAETSAALAAASLAFQEINAAYSSTLLTHARQLYDFAKSSTGIYSNTITEAAKVYSSSGYEDELLWAAVWLYRATEEEAYLEPLSSADNTGGARTTFSWDDKFVGAQVLAAKLVLEGDTNAQELESLKDQAEQFICSCLQKGDNNIKKTPGGLLWFLPWNNVQYVATASFVTAVYSNYLTANKASLECSAGSVSPGELLALAQSQVDYILGANPKSMSYMVGFGTSFPQQIHHRGASIVSIKKDPSPVSCKGGFDTWYNKKEANPNVLDGAIVGPDENDAYTDARDNFQHAEPTTVTTAPFVGLLAQFA